VIKLLKYVKHVPIIFERANASSDCCIMLPFIVQTLNIGGNYSMKGLFTRKQIAFFATLFIIGFFIGYDYSLVTSSRPSEVAAVRTEEKAERENRKEEFDGEPSGTLNDGHTTFMNQ
jgi:hypothetical protein